MWVLEMFLPSFSLVTNLNSRSSCFHLCAIIFESFTKGNKVKIFALGTCLFMSCSKNSSNDRSPSPKQENTKWPKRNCWAWLLRSKMIVVKALLELDLLNIWYFNVILAFSCLLEASWDFCFPILCEMFCLWLSGTK